MEHGNALPSQAHTDPGDFVAEEKRIEHAKPNYIGVFVILGVLTAIEIGITTLFHDSIGRVPILLFLTVAKGSLVVLYYMHLRFDSRLYAVFFGSGIFALAIPYVLALLFLISPPQLVSIRANGGGGNEGQPVARPTANPNAGPPVTFNLDGTEFQYTPNTLSANSGQAVNIVLKNTGSVNHTFVIALKTKADDATPWTSNDGKQVAEAAPGASARGGFIAPAPGEYFFYCNVPGHAAAGMFGTFTVK